MSSKHQKGPDLKRFMVSLNFRVVGSALFNINIEHMMCAHSSGNYFELHTIIISAPRSYIFIANTWSFCFQNSYIAHIYYLCSCFTTNIELMLNHITRIHTSNQTIKKRTPTQG